MYSKFLRNVVRVREGVFNLSIDKFWNTIIIIVVIIVLNFELFFIQLIYDGKYKCKYIYIHIYNLIRKYGY